MIGGLECQHRWSVDGSRAYGLLDSFASAPADAALLYVNAAQIGRADSLLTTLAPDTVLASSGTLSSGVSAGGYGTRVFRTTSTGAVAFETLYNIASGFVQEGKTYTGRVKIAAVPGGRLARLTIDFRTAANAGLGQVSTSFGGPGEYSVSGLAPATAAGCYLRVTTNGGAIGEVLDVDGFLLVAGSAPPYFDGDSANARWLGVRFKSRSELYDRSAVSVGDLVVRQGTVAVSGGALVSTATTTRVERANLPMVDGQVTAQALAPTGVGDYLLSPGLRVVANGAYLFAANEGANLRIFRYNPTAATITQLATVAITAPTAGNRYWAVIRSEGDLVTAEWWTTDPAAGGAPAASTSVTLTGWEQVTFGAGVEGTQMAMGWGSGTLEELRIEPYVYAAEGLADARPNGVTLNDLGRTSRFEVTRISGLHALGDLEDGRRPRVARLGETPGRAKRKGKTVTYEGAIVANTFPALRRAEEQLLSVFDPVGSTALPEGRMGVVQPGGAVPTRFFRARPLSCDVSDQQETAFPRRKFTLSLRLSDPRVFDPVLSGPYSTPALAGGPPATADVLVPYAGSADADPVLDVTGPITDPVLTNVTTGRVLAFTAGFAIAAGVTLRVDFSTRRVWIPATGVDQGGSVDLSKTDWWDRGEPGLIRGRDNTLRLAGTGTTSAADLTVRYHRADVA